MKQTKEKLLSLQVRKTRKQKNKFIDYVTTEAKNENYKVNVEEGRVLIKCRNVVVGDIKKAKYIFTAHYDTCAHSPAPVQIWLKNPIMYILTQCLITVFLFALALLVATAAYIAFPAINMLTVFEVALALIVIQFTCGIANPHTANDNTSGVLTLLELMKKMPEEKRDEVAFVFFDNEEYGLLGSALFSRKHKEEIANAMLINFDCVGEGKTVMLAYNKQVKEQDLQFLIDKLPKLAKYKHATVKGHLFSFSSDQLVFENAVGICTANKSWLGGYTFGKVHTFRDNVLNEENINYLVEWAVALTEEAPV